MYDDSANMRYERKSNEEMLPEDVKGKHIDIIKEQVLDLNDKFDFLVSLMIKG